MFSRLLDRVEGFILITGMLIMVFMNFANVVSRKLFPQTPFSYTEELVVVLFMWVTMLGISYAYRINAHTALNILYDLVPRGMRKALVIFSALCSIILMLILIKTGTDMVINQIKFNQVTPGMRLPMAVNSIPVPLGSVIAIFSIIRTSYIEIKLIESGEETIGEGDIL